MKLITEPRLASEKSLKAFVRHGKIALAAYLLERIRKAIKPPRSTRTGRKLLAAVLRGPRDLKLECIPEEAVQPTQVLKLLRSTSSNFDFESQRYFFSHTMFVNVALRALLRSFLEEIRNSPIRIARLSFLCASRFTAN